MKRFKGLFAISDITLYTILAFFQIIALAGFLYSVVLLITGRPGINTLALGLYALWFGVAIVGIYGIRKGEAIGAYSIAAMTLVVSVYELARGTATLGGASLALVVIVLTAVVIFAIRKDSINSPQ